MNKKSKIMQAVCVKGFSGQDSDHDFSLLRIYDFRWNEFLSNYYLIHDNKHHLHYMHKELFEDHFLRIEEKDV